MEELKRIDNFLDKLSSKELVEILDRNGYGKVGAPLENSILNDLKKKNKELLEVLEALIISIEPRIQDYGNYMKHHPLYEEWKDAKEVLTKYKKETINNVAEIDVNGDIS